MTEWVLILYLGAIGAKTPITIPMQNEDACTVAAAKEYPERFGYGGSAANFAICLNNITGEVK